MQSLANETEPEVWPQIVPLLEDAMARLGRRTVTPLCSGSSKGRVSRKSPVRRGRVKTRPRSEFIMPWRNCAAISPNAAWFRPPPLWPGRLRPIRSRLRPGCAGAIHQWSPRIAKGAAVSGSTLALVKATLKSLLWAKIKSAAGLGAGLLAAGAALTVAVVNTNDPSARRRNSVFSAQGICRFTVFNSTGTETTDYPFTWRSATIFGSCESPTCKAMRWPDTSRSGAMGSARTTWTTRRPGPRLPLCAGGRAMPKTSRWASSGPRKCLTSRSPRQAGAIWLAYASGRYFDAATSSRLQPAATLLVLFGRNVQPNSFALQQAFWSRRQERPGVPLLRRLS